MKKLIEFPRTTAVFDCTEVGYPGVTVEYWANPSRNVRLALMRVLGGKLPDESSEEELDEKLKAFWWAVSQFIVTTNIQDADFSTAEKAEETSDDLEPRFIPAVIGRILVDMFDREDDERKKFVTSLAATPSTDEGDTPSPSDSES